MKSLTLKRISTNDDGTYGVLIENTTPFALTLEDPWLNNQRYISCIPSGTYVCAGRLSPKFGATFEVKDVPDREDILFHRGNTEDDTKGCILVGEQFEYLAGRKTAVIASRKGFAEFMDRLSGIDQFLLTIIWA
jgi:hypothetical protein